MNSESLARASWSVGMLPLCVVVFLLADLLLIGRAWFLENDRLLVAMALPLSQCSLIAVWAGGSHAHLYVRFAVPLIVLIVCWYVLTKIMPWGLGEPASAAWAMALALQAPTIVAAMQILQRVSDTTAKQPDSGRRRMRLSFNLQTLMLWMTAIALGFGFIQFGRSQWLWNKNVAEWDYLAAIPFIAVFNAVVVLLWSWAFVAARWKWRVAKIVLAVVLITCLGYSLPHLIDWATATAAIGIHESLVLSAAQSCFIASTLAVVIR